MRRLSMSAYQARLFSTIVAGALLSGSPLAAQTKPKVTGTGIDKPASAIFIGNSFFYYNNSLHNHFRLLLLAGDANTKFRATSVTISGSGADWHDVESYFRPNAIGTYSFDTNNNVVFNKIGQIGRASCRERV